MRYDFNRRERRAPEVANVTKADVVAAWNKWYAPGVASRKPAMLHFYSLKHAQAKTAEALPLSCSNYCLVFFLPPNVENNAVCCRLC